MCCRRRSTGSLYDEVMPIAGPEGMKWAKALAQKEGIFTGISGGSTFAVARQVAETRRPARSILLHASRHRRALHDDAAVRWHRGRDGRGGESLCRARRPVASSRHDGWYARSDNAAWTQIGSVTSAAEETLDPSDWADVQDLSHRIVDDAVAYLRDVRQRPVWQEMPGDVKEFFTAPCRDRRRRLPEVYGDVVDKVMPYPMGNIHPRFWSWYMGSSNFTGALGDFLAAIQGSNLGGGNHAAALMDDQVVDWCKQMIGFPASASGTLVSGGSMANIIGLTVARNTKAGIDVREHGVARHRESRCASMARTRSIPAIARRWRRSGSATRALRRIPTSDASSRIDIDALRAAIAEDRAAGFKPACIIGNAGTVNTGAIDDLQALAKLAHEEDLWFHVDGCIGALIAIAPENAHRVAGIEWADPVALDPHINGCTRRSRPAAPWSAMPRRIAKTFAVTPEYLESTPRGLASGQWLHDYGSADEHAGFAALKVVDGAAGNTASRNSAG